MDKDRKLSDHLRHSEVVCKCGNCNGGGVVAEIPVLFEMIRRHVELVNGVETPIYVNSGYRCKRHNREVGGAQNSLHMNGEALDMRTPEGMSNNSFYVICCVCNPDGGNGKYDWGCHVDTGKRRRWSG